MSSEARNLDTTTSSMDVASLNNLVVSMRPLVKRVKVQIIHKLSHKIKLLRIKKGTDDEMQSNSKKADRLVEEIKCIKCVRPDVISKFSLGNTASFEEVAPKGDVELRAYTRMACHKIISTKVSLWRSEHDDWKALAAFIKSKNTGRRFKNNRPGFAFSTDFSDVQFQSNHQNYSLNFQDKDRYRIHSDLTEKTESVDPNLDNIEDQFPEKTDRNLDYQPANLGEKVSESKDPDITNPEPTVYDEKNSEHTSSNDADTTNSGENIEEGDSSNTGDMDSELSNSGDELVASNSSDGDQSDEEFSQYSKFGIKSGRECEPEAVLSEPTPTVSSKTQEKEKPATGPTNKEIVIKKLNLDSLQSNEVDVSLATKETSVTFLFDSKVDNLPPIRKRDSFFDCSDEDSDNLKEGKFETTGVVSSDEEQEEEFDREKMRKTINSLFVSNLSSRGNSKQGIQSKWHRKEPNYKNTRFQERKPFTKKMSAGKKKQFDRQAAFIRKKQASDARMNKAQPWFGDAVQQHHKSKQQTDAKGKLLSKETAGNDNSQKALHPSWEASKKRKKMENKIQAFQGKKTTFSDDD